MDDIKDFVVLLAVSAGALLILVFVACLPWFIFGDLRVADIKRAAAGVWEKNGFEVVGYEGYELTLLGRPGGCVWYIVKRDNTSYHGCISKWGDEYHIYELRALNAIKGD